MIRHNSAAVAIALLDRLDEMEAEVNAYTDLSAQDEKGNIYWRASQEFLCNVKELAEEANPEPLIPTKTYLKLYEGQIPFNNKGDLETYTGWGTITWVDNFLFDDTLIYKGYSRGRSAANLGFQSKITGKKYTVFLGDFENFVNSMVRGVVKGRFTFCKRGTNYGLIKVEDDRK